MGKMKDAFDEKDILIDKLQDEVFDVSIASEKLTSQVSLAIKQIKTLKEQNSIMRDGLDTIANHPNLPNEDRMNIAQDILTKIAKKENEIL